MREIYLFPLAERFVNIIIQLLSQRYIAAGGELFSVLCEILNRWFFLQFLPQGDTNSDIIPRLSTSENLSPLLLNLG